MLDRLILPSPSLALVALLPQVPSLAPLIWLGTWKKPRPLASLIWPENQGKGTISYELVVHFPEWTTGSIDLAGNQGKSPISREPVAHFPEWTTSSSDFARSLENAPISYELVDHSLEWTTSSKHRATTY